MKKPTAGEILKEFLQTCEAGATDEQIGKKQAALAQAMQEQSGGIMQNFSVHLNPDYIREQQALRKKAEDKKVD